MKKNIKASKTKTNPFKAMTREAKGFFFTLAVIAAALLSATGMNEKDAYAIDPSSFVDPIIIQQYSACVAKVSSTHAHKMAEAVGFLSGKKSDAILEGKCGSNPSNSSTSLNSK